MCSKSEHWDTIFEGSDDYCLGWYEKDSSPTLKLLADVPTQQDSTIFVVGVGTSELVEDLLVQPVQLILNDISSVALNRVKKRLTVKADTVQWLCQDISQPLTTLSFEKQPEKPVPMIDIWVDRAVLHFLNKDEAITGYFENLKTYLKKGGYALFAEFSKSGASKCAGLPVHRYSAEEISTRLGSSFCLEQSFHYNYTSPAGHPRPYIYCLFKRVS
ncbi:MAG: methyltransferase domain-containing protein [Gammaproteobacteria bacterium]|nr:methyltransferase domain-containing protein [Gammaproteobacteria bacterium]